MIFDGNPSGQLTWLGRRGLAPVIGNVMRVPHVPLVHKGAWKRLWEHIRGGFKSVSKKVQEVMNFCKTLFRYTKTTCGAYVFARWLNLVSAPPVDRYIDSCIVAYERIKSTNCGTEENRTPDLSASEQKIRTTVRPTPRGKTTPGAHILK